MTMDDQGARNGLIDEDLVRHVDAYKAALDPDPDAVAGIRAHVMRAAEARRSRPASRLRRIRGLFIAPASGAFRRPIAGFAAASLLVVLAVGGTFAATAPGAPLYGARLWLEDATLPVDAAARADAEMNHLRDRLGEAQAGARDGNGAALTAAIEAYRATLDAALRSAGGDVSREQRLEQELGRHRAVLEALVASQAGHGNAAVAIQAALDRNAATIDQILGQNPGRPDGTGAPGNAGGPGAGGAPTGGPGNGPTGPAQGGAGSGQGPGQGAHPTGPPGPKGPDAPRSPDPSKTRKP